MPFRHIIKRISNSIMSHSLSRSPTPPNKRFKVTSNDFESINYANGLHLAPMVRSGTLPTRLISLEYGASLVWTPEVIDKAIIDSKRIVNPSTGVIDYVKDTENKPIWSTHPLERPYVIYQIGSSNPQLAVEAAKTVSDDVAGIDLNCGCPKHFSIHAGMGAALLTNSDNLINILKALCEELPNKSISCKIRLLSSQQDTIELVKRICSVPIKAITIHCRTKSMRPTEPALHNRLSEVRQVIEDLRPDVTVICNGDGVNFEQAQRIKELTGVSSVMIARGAEANPTCFSPDGESQIAPYWLQMSHAIENIFPSTKYCLTQMSPFARFGKVKKAVRSQMNQNLSQAKTNEEVAKALKVDNLTSEKGLNGDLFENLRKVIEDKKKHV